MTESPKPAKEHSQDKDELVVVSAEREGWVQFEEVQSVAPTPRIQDFPVTNIADASMPEEDVTLIKQVMSTIPWPEDKVPLWAKLIPEHQWMPKLEQNSDYPENLVITFGDGSKPVKPHMD